MSEIEIAGDMYTRLGIDGRLWAEEMHKRFSIPVDDLLPWTCSMCMAGYDKATRPDYQRKIEKIEGLKMPIREGAEFHQMHRYGNAVINEVIAILKEAGE